MTTQPHYPDGGGMTLSKETRVELRRRCPTPEETDALLDMTDERDRYRALLREAHAELKHARVFISSREKMHPTGVEINDELVARIDAALEGKINE